MGAGARQWSVGAAAGIGAALTLVGIAAVAAANRGPAGVVTAPAGAPAAASAVSGVPPRLSQTGLYAADGSIDPRNRPFAPQYPLWTDGAAKSRWVRLPEGSRIDVSDVDAWRFPEGTTFWKEFAWPAGDGSGRRKVETRMIRRAGDAWQFATYVWTEDQSDAVLAPAEGVRAAHEIAPGRRHSIPGVADCKACHDSAPAVVLGFTALQLSDDRDPLAPHAEALPAGALTLRSLVAEDLLAPARPELAARPPRIRESDPVGRAALGYLSANCGGCHNAGGPLARLGFVLLHDAAGELDSLEPVLATAVDVPGRYAVPGVADGASRLVAPGLPESSALLYRMQSRRPASQMPPLGTVVADEAGVDLVRRWIQGLRAREVVVAAADPARRPR